MVTNPSLKRAVTYAGTPQRNSYESSHSANDTRSVNKPQMHLSNLSQDEAIELGSKIGALIGLGFEGEDGMAAGAQAGAEAAT